MVTFFYRAECHLLVITSLKKIGVLDGLYIFTHTNGLNDIFYCEDKPNNNKLNDQKKTKIVREQPL